MNEKRAKNMRRLCKKIAIRYELDWKQTYKRYKKFYKENSGK